MRRTERLDLGPLAAQLVHLLAEAIAHLVELGRQAGDLVVAANRDPAREVALTEALGRLEHLPDLPAQRAHDEGDRRQRDEEEHEQGDRERRA